MRATKQDEERQVRPTRKIPGGTSQVPKCCSWVVSLQRSCGIKPDREIRWNESCALHGKWRAMKNTRAFPVASTTVQMKGDHVMLTAFKCTRTVKSNSSSIRTRITYAWELPNYASVARSPFHSNRVIWLTWVSLTFHLHKFLFNVFCIDLRRFWLKQRPPSWSNTIIKRVLSYL